MKKIMNQSRILLALLMTVTFISLLHAESATISWSPNSESDLSGYKIYYGVNSRNYDDVKDAGNVTSYTVDNLNTGTTYYFAVTAYDLSGNESTFSDEVSVLLGSSNPPELVDIFVNGQTQLDVVFSEELEKSSAETITNYTISDGVQVLGAVQDGTTVRLITSSHTPGQSYILSISNVKDNDGNSIAAGSSRGYSIPTTSEDTIPPQLVHIEVVDASHINVIFNEAVEESSAETIENYAIDNDIQVVQATRQPSLSVVQLLTTQHQDGFEYTLTVNNVTDTATPANVIAANSNYSYEVGSGGVVDDKAPEMKSVVVQGATQLDINFSEPVSKETAETKLNYRITPDINVVGAVLDASQTTVHLITTGHQNNVTYVLTVNNIRDLADPPNRIADNSQLEYLYQSDDIDEEEEDKDLQPGQGQNPNSFTLFQNYPNPFNPETEIRFFLDKDRQVELNIYNLLGQKVKSLVNDEMEAGYHTVVWDGKNIYGRQVPSGTYIYSLEIKRDVLKGNRLVSVSLERRVMRMTMLK